MAKHDDEPIEPVPYDIEGVRLTGSSLGYLIRWLDRQISFNVANHRCNSLALVEIKKAMLVGTAQQLEFLEKNRKDGLNAKGFFPDQVSSPFSPYDDRFVGWVIGRFVSKDGLSDFLNDWLVNGEPD